MSSDVTSHTYLITVYINGEYMKFKFFILLSLLIFFSLIFILWNYGINIPQRILILRLNIFFQAIIVAGILSLSGWILQILLFNPLAEPYLLGVSGAASFGAVISVFSGLTPLIFFRTFFSLSGSLLFIFVLILWGSRKNLFSIERMVLLGISFNSLFSALIILFQSFLLPNDFYSSVRWLMGNFDYISLTEFLLLLSGILVLLIYYSIFRKELYIYQSGEEMAVAVGVDTERLKFCGFLCVAYATGVSVSICGMIGFFGLIVPHIVRMLFFDLKDRILPPVLLISGVIITFALWVSRNALEGTVIPVGVITSLLGSPFFIYLILRKKPTS
ncbi:MAG: FecCD family ABC transporter permease [Brevinematia bacterium]